MLRPAEPFDSSGGGAGAGRPPVNIEVNFPPGSGPNAFKQVREDIEAIKRGITEINGMRVGPAISGGGIGGGSGGISFGGSASGTSASTGAPIGQAGGGWGAREAINNVRAGGHAVTGVSSITGRPLTPITPTPIAPAVPAAARGLFGLGTAGAVGAGALIGGAAVGAAAFDDPVLSARFGQAALGWTEWGSQLFSPDSGFGRFGRSVANRYTPFRYLPGAAEGLQGLGQSAFDSVFATGGLEQSRKDASFAELARRSRLIDIQAADANASFQRNQAASATGIYGARFQGAQASITNTAALYNERRRQLNERIPGSSEYAVQGQERVKIAEELKSLESQRLMDARQSYKEQQAFLQDSLNTQKNILELRKSEQDVAQQKVTTFGAADPSQLRRLNRAYKDFTQDGKGSLQNAQLLNAAGISAPGVEEALLSNLKKNAPDLAPKLIEAANNAKVIVEAAQKAVDEGSKSLDALTEETKTAFESLFKEVAKAIKQYNAVAIEAAQDMSDKARAEAKTQLQQQAQAPG